MDTVSALLTHWGEESAGFVLRLDKFSINSREASELDISAIIWHQHNTDA